MDATTVGCAKELCSEMDAIDSAMPTVLALFESAIVVQTATAAEMGNGVASMSSGSGDVQRRTRRSTYLHVP